MTINSVKENIYNKYSDTSLSINKMYLKNAYGNTKNIKYGTKNSKRKAIYKASIIATTAIAAGAVAASLFKGNNYAVLNKNLKIAEESGKQILSKISNFLTNCISVKDDLWDKFIRNEKLKKIPGFSLFENIADKVTTVWKKGVRSSIKPRYNEIYDEVVKAAEKEGLKPDFIQNYDKFYDKIDKSTYKALHQQNNRVTDNLFNANIFKRMFNTVIANDKIAQNYGEIISPIEIKSEWSNEFKDAIAKFDEKRGKIFNTLTSKMRDINCGSAPTDFLTIIASLLGLGTAIHHADSKEERKSTVVNLGIPLITTIASTTFGTIRAYSGAKSLLFGLAMGQIGSRTAKAIDKKINNHN